MKNFIVLGTGCKKCVQTAEILTQVAQQQNVPVSVNKETDPQRIMAYGVMSTPAVVLDEQLVHSGSIPTISQIKTWLE